MNLAASAWRSFFYRKRTPAFEDIPTAAGGALAVGSHPESNIILQGVMQASVTRQPGAVFLLGMSEDEVLARYPTAQALEPVDSVGRVTMTPSSVFTILRVLFGTDQLADYLMEIVLLEHIGLESDRPAPLAMMPTWAEQQLTPTRLLGLLYGFQRTEGAVGAAFKSLQGNPKFTFGMLDELQTSAASGKVSHKHRAMLEAWASHCAEVVKALRETIDNPPLSLRLLPAIRDAQESSSPSVWYLKDEVLKEVADTLDVLVLSHGLRQRHHWYIDASVVGALEPTGLNALSRLGAALWQNRAARESGYGPALWCHLGSEITDHSGKGFDVRCAQGCSIVLGNEPELIQSIKSALPVDQEAFDWSPRDDRFGMYRHQDASYRNILPHERSAIGHHVCMELPTPA